MKECVALLLLLSGCASFSTTQTDVSTTYTNGVTTRTITTTVKARSFWDSTSTLTTFKASQTDKTQGASVGSLAQTATSTNVNQLVEGIVSAAVKAAVKP